MPDLGTLNVRQIGPFTARALKSGAHARGLTIAQYLHRLALLHVAVRELAATEPRAASILATLGLETVST